MKTQKSMLCLLLIFLLTFSWGCDAQLPAEDTGDSGSSEAVSDPVGSTPESGEATDATDVTTDATTETGETTPAIDTDAILRKYFGETDFGEAATPTGLTYPEVVSAIGYEGTLVWNYKPAFAWMLEPDVRLIISFTQASNASIESSQFLFPDDYIARGWNIFRASAVPSTTEDLAMQVKERMTYEEAVSILGSEGLNWPPVIHHYGSWYYEWELENGKRLIITAPDIIIDDVQIFPPWNEMGSPKHVISELQVLQIKAGMTYTEVCELLGTEGVLSTKIGSGHYLYYLWWTDTERILRITFKNPLDRTKLLPNDWGVYSCRLYSIEFPSRTEHLAPAEKIEQIESGMTYKEVVELLGGEGILYRVANDVYYQWKIDKTYKLQVYFEWTDGENLLPTDDFRVIEYVVPDP